jgi:hypothetical protein
VYAVDPQLTGHAQGFESATPRFLISFTHRLRVRLMAQAKLC